MELYFGTKNTLALLNIMNDNTMYDIMLFSVLSRLITSHMTTTSLFSIMEKKSL